MFTLSFLRSFRLEGYAIFDLSISFLGMALFAPILTKICLRFGLIVPKVNWIWLTLPIGIITHLAIGKMTPMTVRFLDPHGDYILKAIILDMLALGLVGIKRSAPSHEKGNTH